MAPVRLNSLTLVLSGGLGARLSYLLQLWIRCKSQAMRRGGLQAAEEPRLTRRLSWECTIHCDFLAIAQH